MVDGIGFSGNNGFSQYSRKDVENLAKFIGGVEILPMMENPFAGFGLMAGLTIIPEIGKIKQWSHLNGGLGSVWTNDINAIKNNYKTTKQAVAATGYTKETYKTLSESATIANNEFLAKVADSRLTRKQTAINAGKFNFWEKAKAFFTGKDAKSFADKKLVKLTKADAAARLATSTSSTSSALTTGAKVSKLLKGNGLFLAIEGGMAIFTQIIPTFSKLGSERGMAQVGKSTAKVAGSVGGWASGAALGAAIGSVLPIAGTAIGAVVGGLIGVACGTIGSSIGTKLATAIVGKDELELAKEKEADENVDLALNDKTKMEKLLADAKAKFESEGTNSQDSAIALKSYNNILSSGSKEIASNNSAQETTQDATQVANPYASLGIDQNIIASMSPQDQAYFLQAIQAQLSSTKSDITASNSNTSFSGQTNPNQGFFASSNSIFSSNYRRPEQLMAS